MPETLSSLVPESASFRPGWVAPEAQRSWRSRSCSLLLVEDDELFAQRLSELLGADGRFEIVGLARDGAAAVELASSLEPDVVLMDIGLPVMDGVEATRQIHAAQPALPVVLISGLDYEEGALEGRAAGAADYVRKGRIELDLTQAILTVALRQHT
jgi:DNA-binding NarL/FixJ family response regulator